jgi:ABC-type oligopeptide transport system substrate-binding subunit
MIRSALALAALLGLAIGSSAAYAGCSEMHVDSSKQTVASVDGKSSAPVVLPSTGKDG